MFICSNCQKEFSKWSGQCSNCHQWNTLKEIDPSTTLRMTKTKSSKTLRSSKHDARSSEKPVKLADLDKSDLKTKNYELKTGIKEFDNTVGGRIIPGQVILFAGSPGVGKSTLSLQITESFSNQGLKILYIAGEESPSQIKHRSDRLKQKQSNVLFYAETNVISIQNYIASHAKDIDLIVVDSIQTLYSPDLPGTSGSISQISECADKIISLAKGFSIPAFIIGHITKSGEIAGPKILEHMVDTVLYFEGDKRSELRVLKVEKNRYGPTDEAGIFKMAEGGLTEVKDTKELFDPSKEEAPGSVYCMSLEGNRPIVVEVQALATKTYFTNPRRTTSGFDLNRLYILLAILDKKLKLKTYEYDVYVNITGGIKINDTGLDLAVIKAIVSSIKNVVVPKNEVYFGEVGLTGEVRKIMFEEKRVKESERLGFKKITFSKNLKRISSYDDK